MKNVFFVLVLALVMAPFSTVSALDSTPTPVLGGTSSLDKVWNYSLSGYVDKTAAASNGTAKDVRIGYGSGDGAEIVYVGSNSPFDKLYAHVGQYGTGSGSLKWEYSNGGTTFKTLALTANTSNDFKTAVSNNFARVDFAPPSDWVKSSRNGVSAYWVRISPKTTYTGAPLITQMKVRLLNVKVKIQKLDGTPWAESIAPSFGTDSTCQSNYVGEYNAGNGMHYYAMKLGDYACYFYFIPDGHIDNTIPIGPGSNFFTSALHDLGTKDVQPRLALFLKDELGNALSPVKATIMFGGALSEFIPKTPNVAYIPVGVGTGKVLQVTVDGYVTENGTSPNGNTAVASVNTTAEKATSIIFDGATPCTGSITNVGNCSGFVRNLRLLVANASNIPLSDANVTLYADSAMTTVATDISKKIPLTKNAAGTTATDGKFRAAISTLAGTDLWYKITATGYKEKTGKLTLTAGALNAPTVVLASVNDTTPLPEPVPEPVPEPTPEPTPEPQPQPADTSVSVSMSLVAAGPLSVKANGINAGKVVVVVRNSAGIAISGKTVTLASSLGGISIEPSQAVSNALGTATFTVKSSITGAAMFTASVDGMTLMKKPTMTFITPPVVACSNPVVAVGSLVKLPDDGNPGTQEDSAVYFYGRDCKRHAFPNSKAYFTWYGNFNGVTVVSLSTLASMPLGSNVRYRPAIKMVKFTTVDKVYVVGLGGVLRWVKSEAVAKGLYGTDWNKKIDDLSDAFYTNYSFGTDVEFSADFQASAETANAATIDDNL